jgi:Nucleotidyltransferase domain
MEEAYLAELTRRLHAALPVRSVYLIGSAARGGYTRGSSDLDVLALAAQPVSAEQRDAVARTCADDALPCPARKLELVVYEPDGETVALNLNTGREGTTTDAAEWFWFVVDRAVAREHARALSGPPAAEAIGPIPDATIDRALTELVAWYEANEPGEPARIAAARAAAWRDRGEWVKKPGPRLGG